jgi:hypothetical protein
MVLFVGSPLVPRRVHKQDLPDKGEFINFLTTPHMRILQLCSAITIELFKDMH